MLGVIVNTIAIILGGTAGLLIKGGLSARYKEIIMQAIGLSVIYVGISSALGGLLQPTAHPLLFIISLTIGGVAGELADLEGKLKALGDYFETRFSKGDSTFSKGFVAASLLFCVGTMAILGSFQSGTENNHSILFAKSVLDGVISIIFASTWGPGVLLSSATVFAYQGTLTIASGLIEPYMSADMLREISIVGGILISALGIDMLGMRKLKVGNLLPSVLVPVIFYLVTAIF